MRVLSSWAFPSPFATLSSVSPEDVGRGAPGPWRANAACASTRFEPNIGPQTFGFSSPTSRLFRGALLNFKHSILPTALQGRGTKENEGQVAIKRCLHVAY